jgi:hypothetical protein
MSNPFAIIAMNQPTPAVVPGTCANKREEGIRHQDGRLGGFM